jgi:YVTN family beta-propeller protein
MKRQRCLSVMFVACLAVLLSSCGGGSSVSTTVSVSPAGGTVILGGTEQFSATVTGPSDTTVSWSVSGPACSGTACGTIDSNGLYTAPTTMPSSSTSNNTVTITATSNADPKVEGKATINLDSGVRVQISPTAATLASGENYTFTATVTGSSNTGVSWTVNGTPNGDATIGQVCVAGSNPCQMPTSSADNITFLAPSSVVGTTTVTLAAASVVDSTQSASVTVTLMPAIAPVIASINPPATAQGAVMQNVYVNAESPSNFFTTSTVLANGQRVPTTFISTSLIRGRVPASNLESAQTIEIAVEAQNGQVSNSVGLTVTPVRPSIVSFSPVSVPQCPGTSCGAATVTLDGGYFSPSTAVTFNGQAVGATLNSPNQLAVSVPGTSLETAGLYQMTLSTPGAALPESAVNVAVEPAPASNPPSVVATVGVGTQPSAVAVDASTDTAVVVNTGGNSISLVNLSSCSAGSCPAATTVPVGNKPTGVAVDPLRHLAIIVNQGDNTLSLVDLTGANPTQTVALPAGYVPVSVGENPLTGHALVANQNTNTATVVDLSQSPAVVSSVDLTQGGTRPGGTGADPQVAIEPRLDWAIVTPGGAGAISAVDMTHKVISPVTAQPTFNIVFSFTLTTSVTGVSLNPSTDDLLLTDPNSNAVTILSLLNESVRNVTEVNQTNGVAFDIIASAANPLTNVGVLVDQQSNSALLVDLRNAQVIGSPVTVGNGPVGVAMDPVTDEAVVLNQADSTLSVLSLGAVRPLAITEASVSRLFASTSTQSVSLIGGGFSSTAAVRIDGAVLPAAGVQWVSARVMNVTIPASYLAGPRILNIDVQNPDGTLSNIFQIPVVQAVPVGNAPVAVAVDPGSNTAVVSNSGSNTVSLINLSTGAVTATVDVGTHPLGIGVLSRVGQAVVVNSGDDTASLVNMCTAASSNASSCTPSASAVAVSSSTGAVQQPVAISIDPGSGVAAIANESANSVSFINAATGDFYTQTPVDQGPIGVVLDPNIQFAAALCGTQSPPTIDILNLQAGVQSSPPLLVGHIVGANLPTDAALDPVNDVFLVADSTGNRILIVDPQNNKITQNVSTGINPTSIAYNFNALEALTVNTESHSASVVEVTPNGSQVRDLLPVDGSSQDSVAINPLTNLAVVADQSNNRVLLVPLAH